VIQVKLRVKIWVRVSRVSTVSRVSCKVSASLRISEKPGMTDPNPFDNNWPRSRQADE